MRRWLVCAGLVILGGVLAGSLAQVGALASVIVAVVTVILAVMAFSMIGRNFRSWGYTEREDDLLVVHGALFKKLVVVPYGRMQLVDVVAGPIERAFGIVNVKLHTAAATTDARIRGLRPDDAGALRDRLAALGEAHAAGL
jgi:uncharacterized protein